MTDKEIIARRDELKAHVEELRETNNARIERLKKVRREIFLLEEDDRAALADPDPDALPGEDPGPEIDRLKSEVTRLQKAVKAAEARIKAAIRAWRNFEGEHLETLAADISKRAAKVAEKLAALEEPYSEVYREWSDLIREEKALVHSYDIFAKRGQHVLGRRPRDIPPRLEVTEERALPKPALFRTPPPEIVPVRPRTEVYRQAKTVIARRPS